MPPSAAQPDLIISLSQDKVRLNLVENQANGRAAWETSFDVDHIFLEDQISASLDQVMLDNPDLIDHFPCVEIVMLDRPNICLSRHYLDNGQLGEIASRHLRQRIGDSLTSDPNGNEFIFCYTVPTATLNMLKEYYSNAGCCHLSSVLWNALLTGLPAPEKNGIRLYFILLNDFLFLIGQQNEKLVYSKLFSIQHQADFFYYMIAASRMLNPAEQFMVNIQQEEVDFEWPGDSILKIDQKIILPPLPVLMSQYKVCES